jgi:hypothetical protein
VLPPVDGEFDGVDGAAFLSAELRERAPPRCGGALLASTSHVNTIPVDNQPPAPRRLSRRGSARGTPAGRDTGFRVTSAGRSTSDSGSQSLGSNRQKTNAKAAVASSGTRSLHPHTISRSAGRARASNRFRSRSLRPHRTTACTSIPPRGRRRPPARAGRRPVNRDHQHDQRVGTQPGHDPGGDPVTRWKRGSHTAGTTRTSGSRRAVLRLPLQRRQQRSGRATPRTVKMGSGVAPRSCLVLRDGSGRAAASCPAPDN